MMGVLLGVVLGSVLGATLMGVAISFVRRGERGKLLAESNFELADRFRDLSLQLYIGYARLVRDVRLLNAPVGREIAVVRDPDAAPLLPSDNELDDLADRFRALSKRGGWMA